LNVDLVAVYIAELRAASCTGEIIVVGPHGTISPEWTLTKTKADWVFRGEFDEALANYLPYDLERCPWVYSSKMGMSGRIAPEAQFSEEQYVNYNAIPRIDEYLPHGWGDEVRADIQTIAGGFSTVVEASRGCSYDCEYCCRSGFRKRLRFKSAKNFYKELQILAHRGVRYVFFIDENFGIPWKKYNEIICELSNQGIRFGFQARPDNFDDQKIDLLGKAGCIYIEYGLEANEKSLLVGMGKYRDIDYIEKVIQRSRDRVPYVFCNIFDVGPIVQARRAGFGGVQTDNEGNVPGPLIPYPGTRLGDRLIAANRDRFQTEAAWEICEALFEEESIKRGRVPSGSSDAPADERDRTSQERADVGVSAPTRFEALVAPHRRRRPKHF
jgi:hypothetical protein